MTRMSKQARRRAQSPRKHRNHFAVKTGPRKDSLPEGYRPHENAFKGEEMIFIPKIK